ncbi:hypothetical protein [Kitasatospora sp. NPDC098663]|uniref:hypothetical protein n=1 Tax=Kitasatospora sp. NPDC098663 TaxID=3364096 RepID=UPI0038059B01
MTARDGGDRCQDHVTAGPGGVMTEEVGCVTGELTVATTAFPGRQTWVTVQYRGADEWYTPTGTPTPLPAGESLARYHERVLDAVHTGRGAVAPAAGTGQ